MRKAIIILLPVLSFYTHLNAQNISFSHLSTSNGLSDNKAKCAATDKNGFLWIGTANGLNSYDGNTVTTYFQAQHPQLCSDDIAAIFCDSRNRIWLGTSSGVTMIDEQRRFHTIIFSDSIKSNYNCPVIIETKTHGMILCTNKGDYSLDEKTNHWTMLKWSKDEHTKLRLRDNAFFSTDQYIETGVDKLILSDYAQQKKIFDLALPFAISACRINNDEIIAAVFKGKLVRISISQKKIIKEYPLTRVEQGKTINSNIVRVRQAANGLIMVSTGLGGLVIFDPVTEKITRYIHDPLNIRSLAENGIDNIFCDETGNVFICNESQGLDYFNTNHYSAGYIPAFTGPGNDIYDGSFNCIRQDNKGRFWIGGKDCLIMFDPSVSKTMIYRYYYPIMNIGARPMRINTIHIDENQRIWVCTNGGGLGVLNESTGSFTIFSRDTLDGKLPRFTNNFVDDIQPGPDGHLWLATYTGLVEFDPATYTYATLNDSIMAPVHNKKRLWRIYTDKVGKLWLGFINNAGLYCFDKTKKQFKHFSVKEGLPSNDINSLAEDNNGNIYVATPGGLGIIDQQGKVSAYTISNGLKYNDCKALIKDKDGNIWISNYNCLVKFSPANNEFTSYDQRAGLTGENFRANAAYTASDGQLYWGTEKGIVYFDPVRLRNYDLSSQLLIMKAHIADSNYYFTGSASVRLNHRQNSASFYFTVPDIYNSRNIQYQYQLTAINKTWVSAFGQRQVNYNSLPPGNYVFKVRASYDGFSWKESVNEIRLRIIPGYWQTLWFRVSLLLLFAAAIWWTYRQRIKKVRRDEHLKTNYEKRIAETEMQALRAQMNPHFMFNSLNSINNFILKNDPDNASGYLTKFSRLMRLILDNSRTEWVLLENELKALELYIEMEKVRFDNSFTYNIEVAKDISPDTITVPPLIIQPYAENAIWHGLLHRKEPGGRLDIRLWKNNGTLCIEIEDNGIGREEATRLKSKTATRQKSHGMAITAERISIVNKVYDVNAGVQITDLKDNNKKGTGTKVLITLKYNTHDSDHSG